MLAIAKAAAADAVATYELANDHPDAGEDAQSRYYRCESGKRVVYCEYSNMVAHTNKMSNLTSTRHSTRQ